MQIVVNGESVVIQPDCSVTSLLAQLGMGQRRVAVEVNREVVPRGHYDDRALQAGDQVEIVHAIGGG